MSAEDVLKRLQEELKLFDGIYSDFKNLETNELVIKNIPQIFEMKNIEQEKDFHPESNLFTHIVMSLEQIYNQFNFSGRVLLLSVLFHDIGKCTNKKIIDGKITFPGHEYSSAKIAKRLLRNFISISQKELDDITFCIENHMKMYTFFVMNRSTRKNYMEHPAFVDLLDLHYCAITGKGILNKDHYSNYKFIKKDYETFLKEKKEKVIIPIPIDGNDLLKLGYKPGVIFREILEFSKTEMIESDQSLSTECLIEKIVKKFPL